MRRIKLHKILFNKRSLLALLISIVYLTISCSGSTSESNITNTAPTLSNISISPNPVVTSAVIKAEATDPDGDDLTYTWKIAGFNQSATSEQLTWSSPGIPGTFDIEVSVSDGEYSISDTAEMTVSAEHQWPYFRGSAQGTGSKTAVDTGSNTGTVSWSTDYDDGYSYAENFVSAAALGNDGSIYLASSESNSTDDIELTKFDKDGNILWQWPKDTSGDITDRIAGTPVIDKNGTVYVGSKDGFLYAVDPDGNQTWKLNLGIQILSPAAIGSDGTIYIGTTNDASSNTPNIFFAVNPDGTEKWRFQVGGPIHSSANFAADGTIYVRSFDGSLYALNPDGTQKWKFTEPVGDSGASPVVSGNGTIYIGNWETAPKAALFAVNPDGTQKWSIKLSGGVGATPVIDHEGTIYVGTWNDYVHAINPEGTEKWKSKSLGQTIQSSPALGSDGTLYVGTKFTGKLFALDTKDGSEVWSSKVCDGTAFSTISAPLTIGPDATVYVHCSEGALKAIK